MIALCYNIFRCSKSLEFFNNNFFSSEIVSFFLFVANAFVSHSSTQTMHIKSIIHNRIAMFYLKPYALAGFEPRSSVPEATLRARAAVMTPKMHQFMYAEKFT
jgi:hypothetical protein